VTTHRETPQTPRTRTRPGSRRARARRAVHVAAGLAAAVAVVLTGCSALPSASQDAALGAGVAAESRPQATVPEVVGQDVGTEAGTQAGTEAVPVAQAKPRQVRPNIVLITADDQTASEMQFMPKTRRLLGRAGATFTDFLSPHPLCCPARAELLSGQFGHNNGVHSNKGPWGGWKALERKGDTLGVWLRRAGYRTGFVGKTLNGYGAERKREVPPGWDSWNATVKGVYNMSDFTVNRNGRLQRYGTYQTDVLTKLSNGFIRNNARKSRPFFTWLSHVAPHLECTPKRKRTHGSCWGPPSPAPRHKDSYRGLVPDSFSDEAFDEEDVSDKPASMRRLDRIDATGRARLRRLARYRAEALQSVDESVAKTVRTLREERELENTVILYTSDNGYLLGEHRFRGKSVGYEQSLRVPLLVRGPDVPAGVTRDQQVSLVDLTAGIATLARAKKYARHPLDGQPFMATARRNRAMKHDSLLIQAGASVRGTGGWEWRGVRTQRYTYMWHRKSAEAELYDRARDPSELVSVHDDPRYAEVRAVLEEHLAERQGCAGASCVRDLGPVPDPS
jgi:N-acetylglucosamine-6-sulfatase